MRSNFQILLSISIIQILLFTPSKGYPQVFESLPLDNWSYKAIEYLHHRGYFNTLYYNTKPWKKREVVEAIRNYEHSRKKGKIIVTKYDAYLFDRLKQEFELYFQDKKARSGYFDLRPDIIISSRNNPTEKARFIPKTQLVLNFGKHATIQTRFEVDTDGAQDLDYRGFSEWKGLTGDMSLANISFGWQNFFFEIGRDYQFWGPGKSGGLILSKNMPTLDLAFLQFTFWRFRFSGFTSILNRMQLINGAWANRYLGGSRIDFKPNYAMELGISQTVLWGGVGEKILPYYANPLVNYYLADTMLAVDNGSTDNNMVAVDFSWLVRRGLKVYGEFLIDDAIYDGSDNPNKLAYLGGVSLADPLGSEGFFLSAEYVRITKWVYTHLETTPFKRYQFYNGIIGHWLGPDSDMLSLSMSYYLGRNFTFYLDCQYVRHGENKIDSPWTDEEGYSLLKRHNPFPSGIIETQILNSVNLEYSPNPNVFLATQIDFENTDNVSNVEGNEENNIKFYFTLHYRFRHIF